MTMEMSSIYSHKSTQQQGDIYSSVLHVYSTILKNLYIYLVFYYYVYEYEWVGCGFQKFACLILSNVGFRDGELKSNLSCFNSEICDMYFKCLTIRELDFFENNWNKQNTCTLHALVCFD